MSVRPAYRKKSDDHAFNILEQEFQMITKQFDLDDWRDCRTEHYWKSDAIKDKTARLMYKIKLVQYYNQHGVPKE
jgi:hypothetical protein